MSKLTNHGMRDFYNEVVQRKYHDDHEFERWFRKAVHRLDHFMTAVAIKEFLSDNVY